MTVPHDPLGQAVHCVHVLHRKSSLSTQYKGPPETSDYGREVPLGKSPTSDARGDRAREKRPVSASPLFGSSRRSRPVAASVAPSSFGGSVESTGIGAFVRGPTH